MKPASNKAADMLAAAPIKFTPVVDFYSEEFSSQYVKGLYYTLRRDAALNEKLASCMETWLDEGSIVLVDPSQGTDATGKSAVSGTGVVG